MKPFDYILKFYNENRRSIFMGVELTGVALSSFTWYNAGMKISPILKRKKEEMDICNPNDKEAKRAVTMETVKEVVPKLILPTIVTGLTGASIIFENHKSAKEIAVISAAYTLTKTNLTDIQNKMNELLGEKKAREIRDRVAKDHYDKGTKPPASGPIILTGGGNVLCKDEYTGRFFNSSPVKIQQAINETSASLQREMFIPLNDFYERIGLDPVKMGDNLGWRMEDTYDGTIPITFSAILGENHIPCLVVEFDVSPERKWM